MLPEWSAALLIGFHLAVVPTASHVCCCSRCSAARGEQVNVGATPTCDVWAPVSGSLGVDPTRGLTASRIEHDLERVLHSDDGCTPPSAG